MKRVRKRALPLGFGIAVLITLVFWSSSRRTNEWQAEITFDFGISGTKAKQCQTSIQAVLGLIAWVDKLEKKRQANPNLIIIVTQDIEEHLANLGYALMPDGDTECQLYGSLIVPGVDETIPTYCIYLDYDAVGTIDLIGSLAHQWEHVRNPDSVLNGFTAEDELLILNRTIARLKKLSLMMSETKRTTPDTLAEQIRNRVIPTQKAIYHRLDHRLRELRKPITTPHLFQGSAFGGSFL